MKNVFNIVRYCSTVTVMLTPVSSSKKYGLMIVVPLKAVICPLFGVAKKVPLFIRVAPVGNWRDNTQAPGYNEIHPS